MWKCCACKYASHVCVCVHVCVLYIHFGNDTVSFPRWHVSFCHFSPVSRNNRPSTFWSPSSECTRSRWPAPETAASWSTAASGWTSLALRGASNCRPIERPVRKGSPISTFTVIQKSDSRRPAYGSLQISRLLHVVRIVASIVTDRLTVARRRRSQQRSRGGIIWWPTFQAMLFHVRTIAGRVLQIENMYGILVILSWLTTTNC